MRLEVGSKVACTGAPLGQIVDVVVDPEARSVTRLVVEPRRGRGPARLVPVEQAESGDERERTVALRLTVGEVRQLPAADDVAYARLADVPAHDPVSDVGVEDAVALPYYPAHDVRADVIRLTATANPFSRQVEPRPLDVALTYDRIPKGEVELRRGAPSCRPTDAGSAG